MVEKSAEALVALAQGCMNLGKQGHAYLSVPLEWTA
jgi:hypothetical protein